MIVTIDTTALGPHFEPSQAEEKWDRLWSEWGVHRYHEGDPRPADSAWRQQVVCPHQPQDATLGGADAGEAQPCPELAVSFAVERAVRQELPDCRNQVLVRHGADRPGSLARNRLLAMAVDGRP